VEGPKTSGVSQATTPKASNQPVPDGELVAGRAARARGMPPAIGSTDAVRELGEVAHAVRKLGPPNQSERVPGVSASSDSAHAVEKTGTTQSTLSRVPGVSTR
jgi:hypothetical protein